MALAYPLNWRIMRKFIKHQIEMFNKSPKMNLSCWCTRYRYHGSVIPAAYYGAPKYIKFENTTMPVPENVDEYLTYIYGDYMTPPPPEARVGAHLDGEKIYFGKY